MCANIKSCVLFLKFIWYKPNDRTAMSDIFNTAFQIQEVTRLVKTNASLPELNKYNPKIKSASIVMSPYAQNDEHIALQVKVGVPKGPQDERGVEFLNLFSHNPDVKWDLCSRKIFKDSTVITGRFLVPVNMGKDDDFMRALCVDIWYVLQLQKVALSVSGGLAVMSLKAFGEDTPSPPDLPLPQLRHDNKRQCRGDGIICSPPRESEVGLYVPYPSVFYGRFDEEDETFEEFHKPNMNPRMSSLIDLVDQS